MLALLLFARLPGLLDCGFEQAVGSSWPLQCSIVPLPTSLQRPPRRSSGYARSLARRAPAKAAAVKSPRRCRGCPALARGGHQRGIFRIGPLGLMVAIGYDLNAAVVETINQWHVQVREQCVSGDPGPRFPAYPGGCPFQRLSPTPQNPRLGTSCAMVAKKA